MYVHATVLFGDQRTIFGNQISLSTMSYGDQIQVVRFDGPCFYSLAGPNISVRIIILILTLL